MTTVQNNLKDRSKAVRKVEGSDQFEWGWEVVNRRKREHSYFNRVGIGTYEQATAWLDGPELPPRRSLKAYQNTVSH